MNNLVHRISSISTFRSLTHRSYRLFFTGQMLSLIGTWMQTMAQAWLVYQLTHSAVWLGTVGFLNTVPMLLFALYGGSIADRYSKQKIILVTQSIALAQALILAVIVFLNVVTVEAVCVLAFMLGTINAFDVPARQSFIVELVGKEHLANAIALNSAGFNGARIIGPAIGGVIIALFGVEWCFFVNACSFIGVIVVLLRLNAEYKNKATIVKSGSIGSLRESIAYVMSDLPLMAILTLVAIVSVFGWSYSVLLPIFADRILNIGAVGLGNLMMSVGIGAFISAVIVASSESRIRPSRFIYSGISLFVVGISIFAISTNVAISIYSLIFVGMGLVMFISTANASIQRRSPDAMRGRVMGLYLLVFQGFAPIGQFGIGWIAEHAGARPAVLTGAAVCGVSGVAMRIFMNSKRSNTTKGNI